MKRATANLSTLVKSDAARIISGQVSRFRILKLAILNLSFQVALMYRLSSAASKFSPALGRIISRINYRRHGAEIDPRAEIGPGMLLQHPSGVVIGAHTKIGSNVTMMSGVVLGRKNVLSGPDLGMYPRLGDYVTLGSHAVLLGPINVGDRVIVGACSLVLSDAPKDSIVVGSPASPLYPNKKQ